MKLIRSLYLTNRFFATLGACVVVFAIAFYVPFLLPVAKVMLAAAVIIACIETAALFRIKSGVRAERKTPEKLSNGDDNEITIAIENTYGFVATVTVVDEIPFQFQMRDSFYRFDMQSGSAVSLRYNLRPVKRGEYSFGAVNVFVSSVLGLVERRFRYSQDALVPVYPSYLQLRRYELMAISNRLTEAGVKKIRKVGHSMEFDSIRQYVTGDDYRTINWKATSRSGAVMVNHYTDEKAQQVYNVIDKGRTMKMPFEGMTLLDYAINASLVMANVSLIKQDKAGLITFSHKQGAMIPAERRSGQMHRIQEQLYAEKTGYVESNYEHLYSMLKTGVRQRSLVLLYTNFETLDGLQRSLPLLRGIAKQHLLVVIFFENTELKTLLESNPTTTEEIYIKTIAEKFAYEKRLIVKELQRYGIQSILTPPKHLTVNTVNKYLELKARRMI